MRFIPYGHQCIGPDDIAAVNEVLRGDWLTTGPKIREFENALSGYIGCEYATAVNSGTSALDISLQVLDLPPGAEVITSPFTFVATSNAILYNHLRPVFADIRSDTRNIDPESIHDQITGKTRAIIAVDYAGLPSSLDDIREIAREHELVLIEDACHALGASFRGRKIGTLADMTIFSFHPVKAITTGEGGAVVTGDRRLDSRLKILRSHGIDREAGGKYDGGAGWGYDMLYLGRNYRMTDMQAALGISQLAKLDSFLARRSEIAALYTDLLGDSPRIEVPEVSAGSVHAWHLFTVLLRDIQRDEFFRFMRSQQVGVNLHYIPVYRFTYYRDWLPIDPSSFPVTEDVYSRIISLPLHPSMTDEEVHYVAETAIRGCRLYAR
jgi:UDP-4-amino-4,6-dideoxy-N-acetyl-beta-L-altrosamine transaminase